MTKQPTAAARRSAAKTIVQTLGDEVSIIAKPLSQVDIRNIPNAVEPAIRNWIKQHGKHEIYGSGAMATHQTHGRQPQDLDLVIDKPRQAANALAGVMRTKGVNCKVVPSKSPGAYVVQTQRGGEWVDALDIHPLEGHAGAYDFYGRSHAPITQNGIKIQRAADQLLRKANAVMQKGGAPAHRELKDTRDFITTAKILVESIETRTTAQRARVRGVKAAIKVWEAHLKTIKGAPKPAKRKQISDAKTRRYAKKAVSAPAIDLNNLVFTSGTTISTRKTPKGKRTIGEIMGDKSSVPYPRGRNPYSPPRRKKPQKRKKR